MEKIILNDKQLFKLVPMGIETNLNDKYRRFSFVSDLAYNEIENAFSSTDNISKIEYLSATDELLKVYEDCKVLKIISKEYNKQYEDDKFADVYAVELKIS